MAKEIERKFLVDTKISPDLGIQRLIKQGYLMLDKNKQLRVRVIDHQSFLCLKYTKDKVRDEYEFVFSYDAPIEYQDKITVVGDNHPNRYFLVTSVDDTTSEGMFNIAKCTESYN